MTRPSALPSAAYDAEPLQAIGGDSDVADSAGLPADDVGAVGNLDSVEGPFVWPPPFPHPWSRPLAALAWTVRQFYGAISLFALLVVAACTPGLNLLALGYLLESEGRVARSGRLRQAFPLLPAAGRFGSICLGCGLFLVPVWLLAGAAVETRLVVGRGWAVNQSYAILAAAATLVGLHLVLALARGGSPGCFLRPIKNIRWLRAQFAGGDYWRQADEALRQFVAAWRLPYHFWLGLRGFVGAAVWLVGPAILFSWPRDPNSTIQRLLVYLGGAGLMVVLAWLPWLQVNLAVENRWSAMFEPARVRELFRHAPFAWLLATVALYALSIPLFLYTLQIRMKLPFYVGAWWDEAIICLACTFPARVFLGWAFHRAMTHGRRWAGFVWTARLVLAGLLVAYVWLLYQTPLTHQSRHPWLLEYHVLLLPIPW